MLEFGDKHRRDAVDDGCPLGIDSLKRGKRIECGCGKNARCAGNSRGHRPDNAPKAVEHRHGNANAVFFGDAHVPGEEASVVNKVHMRKQHALGLARRARSVLDVRRLIGVRLDTDAVRIA